MPNALAIKKSLGLLFVVFAAISASQSSFGSPSLQVPLCKLIGSESSSLEKKQDVTRRAFPQQEGVEVNMIDMRTHDAKSADVQIEHQSVRQSIIFSYRNNKLLSKKVLDSFQEGYDKYGLDPVSYFYLTHSDPLSITGRTVLGTIKLLHFKKTDPIVEWIRASKKEDVFLKEWPLLELEKKAKLLVVEHQTKAFTQFREILRDGFDEFHRTHDPSKKESILARIALAKALLPESTFSVAEITGVTSVGKSKAGFDVFRSLENEVLQHALTENLNRVYLLAAKPELVPYYLNRNYRELYSYGDSETSIVKTAMYREARLKPEIVK